MNAIENTVSEGLGNDVFHMFISLIESLTPSYFRVLKFLSSATGNDKRRSELLDEIDAHVPDLAKRGVRDRILLDLQIAGLIVANVQPLLSSAVVTYGGNQIPDERLTTNLGDEFIALIGEPRVDG